MNDPDQLYKKLRFSDVALAIETSPKSLRNWLQRGQVELFTDRDDGWHEFTYGDVAVLAIVRKLVDFGVGVPMASQIAHEALAMFPEGLRRGIQFPRFLVVPWEPYSLLVWPDGGDAWRLNTFENVRGIDGLKRLLSNLGKEKPITAFLFIDMAGVLSNALGRARECATNGEASSVYDGDLQYELRAVYRGDPKRPRSYLSKDDDNNPIMAGLTSTETGQYVLLDTLLAGKDSAKRALTDKEYAELLRLETEPMLLNHASTVDDVQRSAKLFLDLHAKHEHALLLSTEQEASK